MKILIIKLGYSETLDPEMGKVVSLGDVVRCTVVLEALKQKYPNSCITWLVAPEAFPLIVDNPYLERVLVWDEFIPFALMREQFDMVVNLEKIHGICGLADMIQAWEKVGFRFDVVSGNYSAYECSLGATNYIQDKANGKKSHEIWQKVIVEMVGCEWREQEYSLGYKPKPKEKFQVGLNYQVGSKWPTKAMKKEKWEELAALLEKNRISFSWQQGMNNLYDYMDWIAGCDVLVTHDSLGVHLALAMKKSVIVLFGATSGEEIYYYGRGVSVYPKSLDLSGYECIPCYNPTCNKDIHCMDFIEPNDIIVYINGFL
ncbi:glycosyltransferase family 9 protein [Helicobacter sp. 14348-15]|uniref:glycosyltransferase family 9 protein n=1 Tax=Helicobacter colisuis TaxID=2949739 RepID=UPI00202B05A5|nr:glycosyltransferase family 9 protein [Helicobacter colisuis]MCL9821291.1 glycosyltransferase family 9 protein [Helicobacter colisuis]